MTTTAGNGAPSAAALTGRVLRVRPENYKFGEGDIRIRILRVVGSFIADDGQRWLQVDAEELFEHHPPRARGLAVRASAIDACRER